MEPLRPRGKLASVPMQAHTERERADHYGTIAAAHNDFVERRLPQLEQDVDETKGAAMAACGMAKEARDEVRGLRIQLIGGGLAQPPLPPMHDRRESYSEIVEHVTAAAESELAKRASNTPGPGVDSTPEEVGELLREALKRELDKRADQDKRRHDEAELAAYRERERAENEARAENDARKRDRDDKDRRARRLLIFKWVLGIAGPLVTASILWMAHIASLKAEGDKRFTEGRASGPAVFMPVPVPLEVAAPIASAAVAASASAHAVPAPASPAAVGPRRE